MFCPLTPSTSYLFGSLGSLLKLLSASQLIPILKMGFLPESSPFATEFPPAVLALSPVSAVPPPLLLEETVGTMTFPCAPLCFMASVIALRLSATVVKALKNEPSGSCLKAASPPFYAAKLLRKFVTKFLKYSPRFESS